MNRNVILLLMFMGLTLPCIAQNDSSELFVTDSTYFAAPIPPNSKSRFFRIPDSLLRDIVIPTPSPFFEVYTPKCGDNFYENGHLRARYQCDENGRFHGEAIHWDSDQNFYASEYYIHGKIYRSKSYRNGEVRNIFNYTYVGAERVQHGKQVEHARNHKSVYTMCYGKYHGIAYSYRDNKLDSKVHYKNGIMVKRSLFDPQGNITSEAYYDDSLGNPIGTWFQYGEDLDAVAFTFYNNSNQKEEVKRYYRDTLIAHFKYNSEGRTVYSLENYLSGQNRSIISVDSNSVTTHRKWSEEGQLTREIHTKNNKLVGEGFRIDMKGYYDKYVQRTEFKQASDAEGTNLLKCYLFNANGDTALLYYVKNQIDHLTIDSSIVKNSYINYEDKCLKHGMWTPLRDNRISTTIEYNHGYRSGRSEQFDVDGKQVAAGDYLRDEKHGSWYYRKDSILLHLSYRQNELMPVIEVSSPTKHEKFEIDASDSTNFTYTCYIKNQGSWTCNFINNVPAGEWKEFHPDRTLKGYGTFENGKQNTPWIELVPRKNGKLKKARIKDKAFPTPTIPDIKPFLENVII